MTKMTKEDRLAYIKDIKEVDVSGLHHLDQVYFAALIEYVYNENNISTENKWFMKDTYTLESVEENK